MGNEESGDPPLATPAGGTGDSDPEPGALLVVRAWRTGSGPGAFRARVIRVGDLPHGVARSTVTSDPDELCALVRAWITETDK